MLGRPSEPELGKVVGNSGAIGFLSGTIEVGNHQRLEGWDLRRRSSFPRLHLLNELHIAPDFEVLLESPSAAGLHIGAAEQIPRHLIDSPEKTRCVPSRPAGRTGQKKSQDQHQDAHQNATPKLSENTA